MQVSKESSLAIFAVLLNLKGNSQSIELSALTTGNFLFEKFPHNFSYNKNCFFQDLLGDLASVQEITPAELFERHGADTLAPIPSTIPIWTEHCAFKNIFMAFVHGCGNIYFSDEFLSQIFNLINY